MLFVSFPETLQEIHNLAHRKCLLCSPFPLQLIYYLYPTGNTSQKHKISSQILQEVGQGDVHRVPVFGILGHGARPPVPPRSEASAF